MHSTTSIAKIDIQHSRVSCVFHEPRLKFCACSLLPFNLSAPMVQYFFIRIYTAGVQDRIPGVNKIINKQRNYVDEANPQLRNPVDR